jgi:hypothetical protein
MRVAIYFDIITGRNDGNPLYVAASLQRMQAKGLLERDILAPNETVKNHGTYDAHFWVDWGEDALTGMIPYEIIYPPAPSIYWCSDSHIGFDYRLDTARKFTHVFVAQKEAVEQFAREGVKAEWLPHAVEPLAYPKQEQVLKEFDVCFVGHINNGKRIDFLDRMFKEFPNFYYGQKLFEEAAEKFGRSKVCLNIAHSNDVNMRNFEIMATGSCLLTEYVPSMEELFENDVHCMWYKTFDEAVDKAKYLIEHDYIREKISQRGYELMMAKHTIDHRVNRMLQCIDDKILVGAS